MAVAIIITKQIQNKNPHLTWAKNAAVGQIVKRDDFPNKFFVTVPVSGGYKYRTDLHTNDGWKPFELPNYDVRTQKLGEIIEQQTIFTKEVLNKTQQEIDDFDQEQLNKDAHQQIVNTRRNDGSEYYYNVMAKIERAWKNGQITNAIANAANTYFDETLEPLLRGNWQKSKTLLAVPPTTQNTVFLNTYNSIKNYVDNYVTQTYAK